MNLALTIGSYGMKILGILLATLNFIVRCSFVLVSVLAMNFNLCCEIQIKYTNKVISLISKSKLQIMSMRTCRHLNKQLLKYAITEFDWTPLFLQSSCQTKFDLSNLPWSTSLTNISPLEWLSVIPQMNLGSLTSFATWYTNYSARFNVWQHPQIQNAPQQSEQII